MTLRSALPRIIPPAIGLTLALSAMAAPSAQAAPETSSASASSVTPAHPIECDPGATGYTITYKNLVRTITHVSGYHLGPGASVTESKTAAHTRTLTSGMSVTAGAGASASGVIFAADAHISGTLAKNKSKTSSKTQTVTFSLSSSKKDRYYAVYVGYKRWTGGWELDQCDSNGQGSKMLSEGTWRSYQVKDEGAALCPAKRYKKGTLPYKACQAAWS